VPLFFEIFSASCFITFLSLEIETSFSIHFSVSLSRIVMRGLLLGMVLSVCACSFHSLVLAFLTCFYCFWYKLIYYYYYYAYHVMMIILNFSFSCLELRFSWYLS
jgi:hypothetical protein